MSSLVSRGNSQRTKHHDVSCRAISLGTGTFHFHQSPTDERESLANDVVDSVTFNTGDSHRKCEIGHSPGNTSNIKVTRNHKQKDGYAINNARQGADVGEKEIHCKDYEDDNLGLGQIRVIFHPSTPSSTSYKTCLNLPPIKELNDTKTLEAIIQTSIGVSVDVTGGVNANTSAINAPPMKMNPSLYIRATDLAHSLPNFPPTCPSTHNFNGNFHAYNQHAHLIKPHSMIQLDNDPSEVFFALNFICSNTTCDETKHTKYTNSNDSSSITNDKLITQPSPLLPSMMEVLMSEGLEFISNSNYWTYYHSSSIRTSPLPPSFSSSSNDKHNIYFPNTMANLLSLPSGSEPTISAVSLSKEQIATLKNDVLMWTDNKNHNKSDNNNCKPSSFHQIQHSGIKSNQNIFGLRAYGIINMKPKEVHDLMLDSGRIKEYHQYAVERNDVWSYDHEMDDKVNINGDECKMGESVGIKKVTKVCHGKNKPPLTRKPIPYETLFHSQEIPVLPSPSSNDHNHQPKYGYTLVTRAVKEVDTNATMKSMKSNNTELMIGSTLFLPVEGHDDLTLFINANLVKSSAPAYLLKKIAMSGGVTYINWIRSMSKK